MLKYRNYSICTASADYVFHSWVVTCIFCMYVVVCCLPDMHAFVSYGLCTDRWACLSEFVTHDLCSARPIVTFCTSYIESFGDGFMIMHYINVRLTLI